MIATPLPNDLTLKVISRLSEIVGEKFVLNSDYDRIAYSRDCFPKMLIWSRSAKYPYMPGAIVLPANEKEIAEVIKYLYRREIPIVPYGGGSGVAGGAMPVNGGVIIDLKRLDNIEIDYRNQTVTAGSGCIGEQFEHHLNRFGFTLGHFPSSMMCSTVGGWLAARSAGQLSTRFGKTEDMVTAIKFITPKGKLMNIDGGVRTGFANSAAPLIMGSEGTLGVITQAVFRLHRLAEAKLYKGYKFRNVTSAVNGMKLLLQNGLAPACLRLYDELDTLIALEKKSGGGSAISKLPIIRDVKEFYNTVKNSRGKIVNNAIKTALKKPKLLNIASSRLPTGCLVIVGFEGENELVKAQEKYSDRLLIEAGGQSLGREPGETWLKTRYNISFKQPPIFLAGAFNDTMEVATDWDNLMPLYRAVKKALEPLAFVMAHFSHAYTDGCSIYFTFAASDETDALSVNKYDDIWHTALSAVQATGATITHHHGVGFSKQSYLFQEYGTLMRVHKALKQVLDPKGIFNPNKLAFGDPVARERNNTK